MIRRPPRSTQSRSSAASDVYKRQVLNIKAMSEIHGGTKWLIFIAVFVPALIFALYQVRVKREAYSAEQDAIEASRLWNIRMLSGKPSPVIMFKSVSKRWVINLSLIH